MSEVETPTPIDLSYVDDRNMRALIALAVSLGWNVHHKVHQPAVLTARDGTQRRVPTDTASVRMSVFQAVLSTILSHTDAEQWRPTDKLMENLISTFKVDVDHARRMRLAVTETVEDHEQHLIALEKTEPGKPREPQPVTQRLEVPELEFVDQVPDDLSPPGTEPKAAKLTTKQILQEQAKIQLYPEQPVEHYPDQVETDAWFDQIRMLPHVVSVGYPKSRLVASGKRRVYLSRHLMLDNGERISQCGWPGCRHTTIARMQGHINSHMNRKGKLAPILQEPAARRGVAFETGGQPVGAEVVEPKPSVSISLDQGIIERYADSAIQLLDIANRFVGDLDKLDKYISDRHGIAKLTERIAELEAENAGLRRKADRYDQLREHLFGE